MAGLTITNSQGEVVSIPALSEDESGEILGLIEAQTGSEAEETIIQALQDDINIHVDENGLAQMWVKRDDGYEFVGGGSLAGLIGKSGRKKLKPFEKFNPRKMCNMAGILAGSYFLSKEYRNVIGFDESSHGTSLEFGEGPRDTAGFSPTHHWPLLPAIIVGIAQWKLCGKIPPSTSSPGGGSDAKPQKGVSPALPLSILILFFLLNLTPQGRAVSLAFGEAGAAAVFGISISPNGDENLDIL